MAHSFSFPEEKYLLVGIIAKPHGLRGEIKIKGFSSDTGSLKNYPCLTLVAENGRLSPAHKVEKARQQGKQVIVKLETISDRNSAERIQGMGILVDKGDLQPTESGEYYWYQLYDQPVFSDDVALGKVTAVFSNGAHDIMVVNDGEKEYLIPVTEAITKEIGENGIRISPPPGLLEINTD